MTLAVVAVIGAATALMAGTIGLVQNDIKRVLAYSTVSQLGYMFLAMGVGAFAAGIFHLYTHAFFKALLFLGSGAVIHALHGEQDLRNMGGLKKDLPITYWTFLIGALAIAGVPLPRRVLQQGRDPLRRRSRAATRILWVVGVLTSLLTATYMFRLVFLTFHGERARRRRAPAHGTAHGARRARHAAWARRHGHGAPARRAAADGDRARSCWRSDRSLAGYVGVPHALGGSNRIEHVPRAELRGARRRAGRHEDTSAAALAHGETAATAAEGAAPARRRSTRRRPRRTSRPS